MEEKLNKIYENNLAETIYGKKEIMLEIYQVLEKYKIKSYEEIIKKLNESSNLASKITTL